MTPSDFTSVKELKAWFRTLDAADKKKHGRPFNERKATLEAVERKAPTPTFQKPNSKYLRQIMSLWFRPSEEWTQEEWNWLHDAGHCRICDRPLFPLCGCEWNKDIAPIFMMVGDWMNRVRGELKSKKGPDQCS